MCFTDGLADLKNKNEEYYDDEKIEKFVKRHGRKNAEKFNEQLLSEIEKFRDHLIDRLPIEENSPVLGSPGAIMAV